MTNKFLKESQKTLRRMEFLKNEIKVYQENIELVNYVFCNVMHNKNNCDLQRKISYTAIPKNESIFRFTLKNLNDQILMMKNELSVLNEYCQ